MKTIEILIGDKTAYFTTKSVTLDNKEYLYAKMSGVNHFADKEKYVFNYEGEEISLPYNTKDAKVLNAIFSQIMKLPQASATTAPDSHTTDDMSKPVEAEQEEKTSDNAEDSKDNDSKTDFLTSSAIQEAVETTKEQADGESKEDSDEKSENAPDPENKEKKAFKAAFKNPFASLKKKTNETSNDTVSAAEEVQPADPEKAVKLKKSLKNFIIVIGVLIVIAVAYFFIFGTNKADSPTTPNVNESQQYDDIDDVIEGL